MRATRKLGAFLKPYWRWAVLGPLCMVLEVAMDLLQPRLIQRIVDEGIARSDMRVVLTTSAWMVGLALIGLLGACMSWGQRGPTAGKRRASRGLIPGEGGAPYPPGGRYGAR